MSRLQLRFAVCAALLSAMCFGGRATAEEEVVRITDDEQASEDRQDAPDYANAFANLLGLESPDDISVPVGSLPLSTPSDSAFVALGISPNDVNRPTSPQTLATDLFGVARDGDGAGFAVSTVPYILFGANDKGIGHYRSDPSVRALSRLQASAAFSAVEETAGAPESAAAAAQADQQTPIRASLGLRWTAFDAGDPRMDTAFSDCLLGIDDLSEEEANAIYDRGDQDGDGNLVNEFQAAGQKRIDQASKYESNCRKEASDRLWNNSAWDMAIAPVFRSDSGDLSDLYYEGLYVSTSISYGFEGVAALQDSAQIIAHVSYLSGERFIPELETTAGETPSGEEGAEKDTLSVGGRLIFGEPDQYFFSFEAVHEDRSFSNLPNGSKRPETSAFKYAFGADYRFSSSVWLSVSAGATSADEEPDGLFSLARVRWVFGNEGSFADKVKDISGGVVAP